MRLTRILTAALSTLVVPLVGACASEPADEASTNDDQAMLSKECTPLPPSWMDTKRIAVDGEGLHLRVGEARPEGGKEPIADVLYLHGFADRMDNHKPLFDEWTKRGARVVSFEYPSHGETCGTSLGLFGFSDLVDLASYVEKATIEDAARPLYLAGWSTGGLIATRLVQGYRPLTRKVSGSMLFAPGIDVQIVVDKVTTESLTRNPNPPHTGPIAPDRPVLFPKFSGGLLLQAHEARTEPYPRNVPTLLIAGGEWADTYANTPGLHAWVAAQRDRARADGTEASVVGIACPGGKHELDNEIEPIGQQVRSIAGEFFADTIADTRFVPPSSSERCHGF